MLLRKIVLVALAGLLTIALQLRGFSEEPPPPRAKDHQRVMYFVDEHGAECPVKSRADWEQRRRDIITGFEAEFGPLPDRKNLGPVKFQVVPETRTEFEKYTREKLEVEVDEGDNLRAWLLVPKCLKSRVPGFIAIHQTNGKLGKDEVAGLGGSKHLQYGLELVERGYVVIAPDYPTLGEYAYDFEKDRYQSGSMKGIWSHMRCVDLLCAHEHVDPERIAAIGHSLGGHNSIFLAVFDPRVQAVVTSCGWTPMHDYYGGKLAGWAGERYAPRIRTVYNLDANRVPFDYYELIVALAPRAFITCSPVGDSNFDVAGVKKAIPVSGNIGAGKYNDGSFENRMLLAQRLAEGMKQAFLATEKAQLSPADIGWQPVAVRLPVAPHLKEDELVAAIKTEPPAGYIAKADQLAWLKQHQAGHEIDVTCLHLRKARLLHLPGELFVEYQLAAKALRLDLQVALAAYGDYGPGYIGTAAAYPEGGYETSPRASNVAPEVEEVLMNAVKKLLSK